MVTKQERITQLEGIAALLIEMANGTEFDFTEDSNNWHKFL